MQFMILNFSTQELALIIEQIGVANKISYINILKFITMKVEKSLPL